MITKNTIKYVQSLYQKKERDKNQLFVIQGNKMVQELIAQATYKVHTIYATNEWATEHTLINNIIICTPNEMAKLSNLSTPGNVVAIVHYNDLPKLPNANERIILVLNALQDPGNMGSIIRIADWYGIQHIVCDHSTADVYNSKTLQASMGSYARVCVQYTNVKAYLSTQHNIPILSTSLHGVSYKTIAPITHGIVIIGNEGNGVHAEIHALATQHITIPKIGRAESLNAAVATGILLAHLVP